MLRKRKFGQKWDQLQFSSQKWVALKRAFLWALRWVQWESVGFTSFWILVWRQEPFWWSSSSQASVCGPSRVSRPSGIWPSSQPSPSWVSRLWPSGFWPLLSPSSVRPKSWLASPDPTSSRIRAANDLHSTRSESKIRVKIISRPNHEYLYPCLELVVDSVTEHDNQSSISSRSETTNSRLAAKSFLLVARIHFLVLVRNSFGIHFLVLVQNSFRIRFFSTAVFCHHFIFLFF